MSWMRTFDKASPHDERAREAVLAIARRGLLLASVSRRLQDSVSSKRALAEAHRLLVTAKRLCEERPDLPGQDERIRIAITSLTQELSGDLMEQVEKVVEVNCPISTVYNQWTQFEEFPRFMAGVKEVRQIDDTHVHWHAEIWGKDKEWDAEITEQEPDSRISWKSVSGAGNAGTVRFEPLGADRTRVRLAMAYEPEGAIENIGDALGIFSSRVEDTVEDFKKFIESRGQETGAWRGEVDHSRKV
ncbi:MAG TPA: SRPBCC family protein [Povalibacter sp.]